MYLHLGQDIVVAKKSIIGLFDLDKSSYSHLTRKYLRNAEKNGRVFDISGELPSVFAVCEKDGEEIVYLSQISTQTLSKRWNDNNI